MPPGDAFFLLMVLGGIIPGVLASYGTPDDGRHPFACAIAVRSPDIPRPSSWDPYNHMCFVQTCGCSLIDTKDLQNPDGSPLVPNLSSAELVGRVLVTAAHCLQPWHGWVLADQDTGRIPDDTEMAVTFAETPTWMNLETCDNLGEGVDMYKVVRAVYNPDFPINYANSGGNIGSEDTDYGFLILEKKVTHVEGGALLNHPSTPWYKPYKFSTEFVDPFRAVGTAGYGGIFAGNPAKGGIGKPQSVDGGNKTYAELLVLSTSKININGAMKLVKGDDTLCYGDSGSAALMKADPVAAGQDGRWVALGVVHGGDSNCRATNTYARIDTALFFEYMQTVDQSAVVAELLTAGK